MRNAITMAIGIIGIMGLLAAGVACGDDAEIAPSVPAGTIGQPTVNAAPEAPSQPSASTAPAQPHTSQPAAAGAVTTQPSVAAPSAPRASVNYQAASSQTTGIWVTGSGEMSLPPDISLVRIGVETSASTVREARSDAAQAMDAVIASVKSNGLSDEDIRTTSFNIRPEYVYQEVISPSGAQRSERVLTGYRVENSAVIKIRDLDAVGTIIDDVVDAGGDSARINGISFSIEDPGQYSSQLRELAVNAAREKAEHLAALSGVTLGGLVYIAETSGDEPVVRSVAESQRAFALSDAAATSVSGGSLDLTLTVRAVYTIE